MSGFPRTKRVTDPLNDRVKARICGRDRFEPGFVSSGSEHSAQVGDDDVSSPSLSDLFYGFVMENDTESAESKSDSDTDRESPGHDSADAIHQLKFMLRDNGDSYRIGLRAKVSKAAELFSCVKQNKSIFQRNVMGFLRDLGYNAAICKTKWESSGGLTAGNYEFIDVIRPDSSNRSTRYFIDLDFASEFEIARPTDGYESVIQTLPNAFVGKAEDLKRILRVVSDAARRSLKNRGLHLPPWRKHRFMQQKWLGPYKRTANIVPATFSPPSPSNETFPVKCRSVGFDTNAVTGRLFFPAATRTR